jgi:hypothetical protein
MSSIASDIYETGTGSPSRAHVMLVGSVLYIILVSVLCCFYCMSSLCVLYPNVACVFRLSIRDWFFGLL